MRWLYVSTVKGIWGRTPVPDKESRVNEPTGGESNGREKEETKRYWGLCWGFCVTHLC